MGTADTIDALESGRVDLAGGVAPPDWPDRAEPLYEVWLAVVGFGEGTCSTSPTWPLGHSRQ